MSDIGNEMCRATLHKVKGSDYHKDEFQRNNINDQGFYDRQYGFFSKNAVHNDQIDCE